MNAERSSHFVEQPVLHNPLVQRAIGWAARRRPAPFAGAAGTSESRLRPERRKAGCGRRRFGLRAPPRGDRRPSSKGRLWRVKWRIMNAFVRFSPPEQTE